MTDLKEVFDMATKQIDPDQDSWREQERRQRRVRRDRRIGAFAAAAVILIVAVAFVLMQTRSDSGLASHGTPASVPVPVSPAWTPVVLGTDARVHARLPGIPANARSLSVAPDGRTVVFVSGVGVRSQIGTVGIDGTGLVLFSPPPGTSGAGVRESFPTSGAMMPAWSPDGSRIAFTNGDLYVMNADGTSLTRLTDGDRGVDLWPTWAPDGRTIVYSNSGTVPIDSSGFSRTQEIWRIPASGGTATRLTHNGGSDDMPAYAPNGKTIAFWRDGRILLMNPDGGNVHAVRGGAPTGFVPRWSPDGSKLIYTSCCAPITTGDEGPFLRVHVLDLDTGADKVLPGLVESDIDSPQWMPSGRLIENRFVG